MKYAYGLYISDSIEGLVERGQYVIRFIGGSNVVRRLAIEKSREIHASEMEMMTKN